VAAVAAVARFVAIFITQCQDSSQNLKDFGRFEELPSHIGASLITREILGLGLGIKI